MGSPRLIQEQNNAPGPIKRLPGHDDIGMVAEGKQARRDFVATHHDTLDKAEEGEKLDYDDDDSYAEIQPEDDYTIAHSAAQADANAVETDRWHQSGWHDVGDNKWKDSTWSSRSSSSSAPPTIADAAMTMLCLARPEKTIVGVRARVPHPAEVAVGVEDGSAVQAGVITSVISQPRSRSIGAHDRIRGTTGDGERRLRSESWSRSRTLAQRKLLRTRTREW